MIPVVIPSAETSVNDEGSSGGSNGGIIAASVSSAVVVLIVAAVVVFFVMKRRKEDNHELELDREENTVFTNVESTVTDATCLQFGDYQTSFNPETAMFDAGTFNIDTAVTGFDYMEESVMY